MSRQKLSTDSLERRRATTALRLLSCCLIVSLQLVALNEALLAEVSGDRRLPQTAEEIEATVLSTVLAGWRSQAAELKSLQFELEITETADAAYLKVLENDRGKLRRILPSQQQSQALPPAVAPAGESGKLPEGDKRVTLASFALDGAKIMFETDGPIFNLAENKYVPRQIRTAYNGTETRSRMSRHDNDKVQGGIWNGRQVEKMLSLLRYVPIEWWIGSIWHDKQAATSSLTLIEYPSDPEAAIALLDKALDLEIWVDPTRDYIVTRIVKDRPTAKRRTQIDVSYQPRDDLGWIIDRWNVVLTSAGGKEVTTCKLSDVKVNKAVDPAVFEIDFPPGALVIDAKQEGEPIYRVDDDGKLVPR